MKKVSLFLTAMLLSLSLMGCNFNQDRNNGADNANTNVDQGTNDNANNNNNNNNGDTNLEVSQDAADRIMEMNGVENATVIVTDQNAYAAVVLNGDNTVSDTDNNGTADNNADTDTNTDTGTNNDADTNNNANNNHNSPDQVLSPDLENKIAQQVREVHDNIQNVYVSLNPDFVDRMNEYVEQINQGDPVEGFFEEFTEAMRRVFPDAR
ncbi:YhcN/YlaJ family sporulation lipoprotein [Sporosarcina jiandibaonis]|uniref:YhcN/YlaJ family sporulation lipoprotein n=1 Tax=Sporosarcina jiandibaonis TaxID=2715535 RepID=UPI0015523807|nr:YhcN/YlaJ family sporulation lipoprotein [Sporosarcina jiandibaonis]